MNQYFATFPAGTFDIIVKHLKSFKKEELKIIEHDDSSVSFEASLSIEKLIEIRYFTNVYLKVNNLNPLIKTIIKGRYFRLMLLRAGSPSPIIASDRAKLELQIKNNYGLIPNTHLSKNDFYIIERSSGKMLLTLRLKRAKFKRDKLMAGQLRPELANVLCLAAGLKSKFSLIDMFAGYGFIPLEAVRGFGCKQVIAIDSKRLISRPEFNEIKSLMGNASNLDFLNENSVDRVITDPPWGIYDSQIVDLTSLYNSFIAEIQRILKTDGVAVILTGYSGANKCFETATKLRLIKKWNILVSGKKATIYKLQKTR